MAVGQAAQAGLAVDWVGAPAGVVGCSAAADEVFAGTFDLAAADALVGVKTRGVVQVVGVGGEAVSEFVEGGLLGRGVRGFTECCLSPDTRGRQRIDPAQPSFSWPARAFVIHMRA